MIINCYYHINFDILKIEKYFDNYKLQYLIPELLDIITFY